MKHKIFSTIGTLTLSLGLISQSVLAGNAGGNAGDYVKALVEAGLYEKVVKSDEYTVETKSKVRADFIRSGLEGIWAIMILLESGYEFKKSDNSPINLTMNDIVDALSILKKLNANQEKIVLKSTLTLDEDVVTALNFDDGHIELNVPRWKEMDYLYKEEFSDRIKGLVAAHEILSIIPSKIETTGIYDVSTQIIRFNDILNRITETSPVKLEVVYPKFYNQGDKPIGFQIPNFESYYPGRPIENSSSIEAPYYSSNFKGSDQLPGSWKPLNIYTLQSQSGSRVHFLLYQEQIMLQNQIAMASTAKVQKLRKYWQYNIVMQIAMLRGCRDREKIDKDLQNWYRWISNNRKSELQSQIMDETFACHRKNWDHADYKYNSEYNYKPFELSRQFDGKELFDIID